MHISRIPMDLNTGMQFLWAHDSKSWLYIHTLNTSSKRRFHARRTTSCNCAQHQVSAFKSSPDFHEMYHESHTPLKYLRLGIQKSRQGKIQTLGQSVCYKLRSAASYFASGKYFMLQQKLLLFTPSLSLSHVRTHRRTPSWLCSDVNRRGKLLPDLSSDQFTPWSMRLVSFSCVYVIPIPTSL